MNTVTFYVNDSALPTITGMIKQLIEVSANDGSRTIRIGGDEKKFGPDDNIRDLRVNHALDSTPYVASIPSRKLKTDSSSSTMSGANGTSQESTPSAKSYVVSSINFLSPGDRADVAEVVKEYVDSSHQFTAFDVTKEVRSRGVRARHGDVKAVVHEMFANDEMLSYVRELIEIDNVDTAPFLYLPNGEDAGDYFPDNGITGRVVIV